MITFTQQYPDFLFPGKNQLATEDTPPDLSIKRGIYSTNPLNWLKISKEIVEEKPDVIITQYWMPFMAPAFGTILRGVKKELKDVPCYTVVHNFKPHESRIGDKQLNKYIANRTDLMICLSSNVADEIRESMPNKKILTLFHPIYDHYGDSISQTAAQHALGLDPEFRHILFFGLVREYKGLDLLIKALPLIKTSQKFKIVIAGEFYEDEKKYLKLIKEHNLEDQIIIENKYISNEDVPKYFCASDAVVLPYRTATQSGVVPVAIHFNKHVIVTKVGGLAQLIIDHNIGLVAESNPEAIAEKIQAYLNKQVNLSTNFDSIIAHLSWQSFFDNFTSELT